MRLAEHLHLSLQRVKRETTSREFLRWKRRLETLNEERTKDEYLIASIVQAIRQFQQSFRKQPAQVSLESCLVDFTSQKPDTLEEDDEDSMTEQEKDHCRHVLDLEERWKVPKDPAAYRELLAEINRDAFERKVRNA